MQDLEHAIRERAYHLWLANGCREGEADAYWLAAERETLAQFTATATKGKAKNSKPKKPAETTAASLAKGKRRAA